MPDWDRLIAWWHSLRCQTSEQILGRLRYETAWLAYPRFPTLVRAGCEEAARRCRPQSNFRWSGEPARNGPPSAGASLLARFQANYFDWPIQAGEIESWIAANPPGAWPSWHPYPTSLRIVNWIRAAPLTPVAAKSLAAQAAFLDNNLEFHLGGNHLLENAGALLAAGLFFEGPDAARWRSRGLDLLCREVRAQVLSDGGHRERSPYYHLRMTRLVEGITALLAARGALVPPELEQAARDMSAFHQALRHLDGSLPLFHDSLEPAEPLPPARGPLSFPASGYYVLDIPEGRLIADYGAPGDSPNPGHHHAGIFSFEISTPAGKVIVDSGTPTYDPGPRRDRLRSTAAHNTVRVDARDQFQVWGGFRVGRRASVSEVVEQREGSCHSITAAHDGYRRLGVEHRRLIVALPGTGWLILDDLTGRGSHLVESFLHLAPGFESLGWKVVPFGFPGPPRRIDDTYSPAPAVEEPAQTLVLGGHVDLPCRFGYLVAPPEMRYNR